MATPPWPMRTVSCQVDPDSMRRNGAVRSGRAYTQPGVGCPWVTLTRWLWRYVLRVAQFGASTAGIVASSFTLVTRYSYWFQSGRSEERRVGKEWRGGRARDR